MIRQIKMINDIIKSQGYASIFLKDNDFEILLFYRNSLKSTPILGVVSGINKTTDMIAIGCLCDEDEDIGFECHTGIYSESFLNKMSLQEVLLNNIKKVYNDNPYLYDNIEQAINDYKNMFYE